MKNILILCTGNSCRSQMMQGYLQQWAGDKARVYSAGIEAHGLNPIAVQVMQEDGMDISHHKSHHIDDYKSVEFDFVITVCDHARENCPWFPSHAIRLHQSFEDPAKASGTEEEILARFRQVRDQIKDYSLTFMNKYMG